MDRPLPGPGPSAPFYCANPPCHAALAKPQRCSGCHQVHYCTKGCQRAHWRAGHKAECRPPVCLQAPPSSPSPTDNNNNTLAAPSIPPSLPPHTATITVSDGQGNQMGETLYVPCRAAKDDEPGSQEPSSTRCQSTGDFLSSFLPSITRKPLPPPPRPPLPKHCAYDPCGALIVEENNPVRCPGGCLSEYCGQECQKSHYYKAGHKRRCLEQAADSLEDMIKTEWGDEETFHDWLLCTHLPHHYGEPALTSIPNALEAVYGLYHTLRNKGGRKVFKNVRTALALMTTYASKMMCRKAPNTDQLMRELDAVTSESGLNEKDFWYMGGKMMVMVYLMGNKRMGEALEFAGCMSGDEDEIQAQYKRLQRMGKVPSTHDAHAAPVVNCANPDCSTPAFKPLKCSRCLAQTYCSKDCQAMHWSSVHKNLCAEMADGVANDVVERWGGFDKMVDWVVAALQMLSLSLGDNVSFPIEAPQMTDLMTLAKLCRHRPRKGTRHRLLRLTESRLMIFVTSVLALCRDEYVPHTTLRVMQEGLTSLMEEYRSEALASQATKVYYQRMVYGHIASIQVLAKVHDKRGAIEYVKRVAMEDAQSLVRMGGDRLTCTAFFINYSELCQAYPTAENILQAVEIARSAVAMTKDSTVRDVVEDVARVTLLRALTARKAYWEVIDVAQHLHQPERFPLVTRILAAARVQLGKYEEAEAALVEAIEDIEEIEESSSATGEQQNDGAHMRDRMVFKILRLFELSRCLVYRGKYQEARETMYKAMDVIKTCPPYRLMREPTLWRTGPVVATMVFEDRGSFQEAVMVDQVVKGFIARREDCSGSTEEKELFLAPGADALRREAMVLIDKGDLPGAEELLRGVMKAYQQYYDIVLFYALPDHQINAYHRAMGLLADVLEQKQPGARAGRGDEEELARRIRLEKEEHEGLEDALRKALLAETREEAAMAAREEEQMRRSNEGGDVTTAGGRGSGRKKKTKSGKARRKAKKRSGKEREQDNHQLHRQGGEMAGGDKTQKKGPEEDKEEEEEMDDDDCVICLRSMDDDHHVVVVLACGHQYHGSCLDLWVNKCQKAGRVPDCPYCRSEIKLVVLEHTN